LSGYHASRTVEKRQIGPTIEPLLATGLEPAGLQAPKTKPGGTEARTARAGTRAQA